MSAVVASIDLPASPERVWDIIMDPQQLEHWVTIHRQLVSFDPGPPREGFRMTQRMSIRGAPVTVTWTLIELEHAAFARWTGRGPARAAARIEYRLTAVDGGTRFDYTNDFTPPMGPLGRMASAALMGGTPEREAQASLALLKAYVPPAAVRA
jgi:uncharacterized protein YndB with AHSA1/START domain